VLANLGNPSEESLDTDVSVGLNSASGFVGSGDLSPRAFAHGY